MDQSQWVHLYRVQKYFPVLYIVLASCDAEVGGIPSLVLDLRIVSREQSMLGGSWWVKKEGEEGKTTNRGDITKFLEQQAKFQVGNVTKRCLDETEFVECSLEELTFAASVDKNLKANLDAMMPTIFSKLARDLIRELGVNKSGHEFVELPDWPTRTEN